MSANENTTQGSCSALLNAGKSPKTSSATSLSNVSSPMRSTVNSNSQAPMRERNASTVNEKSVATLEGTRSKNSRKSKKQKENSISTCNCTDCATLDNAPKYLLRELEDQLRTLKMELSHQKNQSQLLRRNVMMAKKVVKMEVGVVKEGDFTRLLKRVSDDSWKGRQELIFSLKRKLRDLSELLEAMNCEETISYFKKRQRSKRNKPSEVFLDERTIYLCLELERQYVWKNAQRYKETFVVSRDTLKNKLNTLTVRNEKLAGEIKSLKAKLSKTPKNDDEKLEEQLRLLESHLKPSLEEKVGNRHKLNILHRQICRNSKLSAELRAKADAEKLSIIDAETKMKSLNVNKENLQAQAEEIKNEKYKHTATMKKKLEDIEQDYGKLATKSEQVPNVIKDGKILIGKLKKLHFNDFSSIKKDCDQRSAPISKLKEGGDFQFEAESTNVDGKLNSYQKKLLKYKAMCEKLERKVVGKLQMLHNVTLVAKEDVFKLLRNRFVLWKLTTDIDVLKVREKKFRKVFLQPVTKQKLFIKKNSSQQLIEVFDERKMKLATRQKECRFLKTTIRRLFTSKEDDRDFLEIFLYRNKEGFSKAISILKS